MSTTERTTICPKCGAENPSWRGRCQTCGARLHNHEDMKLSPPRGCLWWTGFIVGLVYAGLLTIFMAIGGSWQAYALRQQHVFIPDFLPLVTAALILGSVVVALKWELISGILLIIEGLFLVICFTIFAGTIFGGNFCDAVLFLPLLASGILFILSWFLSWRAGWRPSKETGG